MKMEADHSFVTSENFYQTKNHAPIKDRTKSIGDRGSTVVKVLCYKSEGRWFDPRWCQWIFH